MTRILGLDPGLRCTGWGIVESEGNKLNYVGHGVVRSIDTDPLSRRLEQLYDGLCQVITLYRPVEAAVEETFVNKNPTSTLKLGMARGVVLLAPARSGIFVAEYSANRVKKSVVGAGHASKDQISMMVQLLLPSVGPVVGDAADALAVAICHAHYRTAPGYSVGDVTSNLSNLLKSGRMSS